MSHCMAGCALADCKDDDITDKLSEPESERSDSTAADPSKRCVADFQNGFSLECGAVTQFPGLCKLVPRRVRSRMLSVLRRVAR